MIYLTNDSLDQAVYLDLQSGLPRSAGSGGGKGLRGVLGNGVNELPVRVEGMGKGAVVTFGKGELFRFVEEGLIRRIIREMIEENALH